MYPARHFVVCCGLLATQLVLLCAVHCLKLDSTPLRVHSPQLDKSGWHTIEVGPAMSNHRSDQREADGEGVVVSSRYKKLIEWDDDENNNNLLGGVSSLILPYEDSQRQLEPQKKQTTLQASSVRPKPSKQPKKAGKLVFHGTLKSSTNKTVDGISLYIDTHRPVPIARNEQRHRIVGRNMMLMREAQDLDEPRQPTTEQSTSSKSPATKKNKLVQNGIQNSLQSPAQSTDISYSRTSNSDWRPLVRPVAGTNRRRSFAKIELARSKHEPDEDKVALDSKWRPIAFTKRGEGLLASRQNRHKSRFEEPFDDEIEYTSTPQPSSRGSKSLSQSPNKDGRWTPVDSATTTGLPDTTELATTSSSIIATSTSLPTVNINSKPAHLKHNSSESIQLRSASDLNYIYSSQPAAPVDWQSRMQTGYYSSAYQPQQQPMVDQQPTFPAGAIVDTTSGQTPETIDSRSELQAQDYSLPSASAAFQPAQSPPTRSTQALPGAYGSGYDNSAYYYSPQPQRQVVISPSPPPSQPNQFVRQEHHYHYYNNNQQRQQQPTPTVASNVIREIQPVVISQPYVQPAAPSPTPSPQIIREIIKEVPVQTVQLQPVQVPRIIVPPPPPPPPPTRELEPSYYPGQRIIRQISGSIPTVGVRQIRLPVPTIQLPVRLAAAAPITRQTGSYIIPPMPQKTTTYLTETQAMPTHTTIMHTTQFTPATRTTVYTTDHQPPAQAAPQTLSASTGYKRR